jgi:ABC-type branched-subunit amino acid transport system ATPase component/ABC-type branched-subunit amino acid transport system permease subunit
MIVGSRTGQCLLGVAALAIASMPLWASSWHMQLASNALVAALFALSLQVLVGATGLVSLAQSGFFGLGAYTVYLLGSPPVWVSLPAAMVVSGIAAVLIGPLALRTKGFFFLMTTLAFGQMLFFAFHDTPLGGGTDGLFIPRPSLGFPVSRSARPMAFLLLNLGVLTVVYAGLCGLMRTMLGHALQGIRSNENRMAAMGHNVQRLKLIAFVVSGALAGLAGHMSALTDGFVSPDLLGWHRSAEALLMILLGGIGALHGPILGAFALTAIQEAGSLLTDRPKLVEGVAFLAAVVFLRHGLAGWHPRFNLTAWRQRRTKVSSPANVSQPTKVSSPANVSSPTHVSSPAHVSWPGLARPPTTLVHPPPQTPPGRAESHERLNNGAAEVRPPRHCYGSDNSGHDDGDQLGQQIHSSVPVYPDAHGAERGHDKEADLRSQPGSIAIAPMLRAEILTRRFGGLLAVDQVSLTLQQGTLHAVIGPNGAGKSTLVNLLSGEIPLSAGRVSLDGQDMSAWAAWKRGKAGIGRTFQRTNIMRDMTVLENARLAAQARSSIGLLNSASNPYLVQSALAALHRTGMNDLPDTIAGTLSHGQARLLEIAIALAGAPVVLLLDEPLAGLGPEETAPVATLLRDLARDHAVLLVEHDMDVVFAVADVLTVMVDGRVLATGTPEEIRASAAVRDAYLGHGV